MVLCILYMYILFRSANSTLATILVSIWRIFARYILNAIIMINFRREATFTYYFSRPSVCMNVCPYCRYDSQLAKCQLLLRAFVFCFDQFHFLKHIKCSKRGIIQILRCGRIRIDRYEVIYELYSFEDNEKASSLISVIGVGIYPNISLFNNRLSAFL